VLDIKVGYVPQRMAVVAWRMATPDTLSSVIDAGFAEVLAHIESGAAVGDEEHIVMYPAGWGCGPGEREIGIAVVIADGGPGPGLRLEELPGCQVVKAVHYGSYATIRDSWTEVEEWMDEHDLEPAAGCWEVYLTDPTEVPELELATELLVPLP
jgi:hypothetical protein